jgi:hypothetical protein
MMDRAIALAREAAERGEVPIGAVVYRGDQIIAEAANNPAKYKLTVVFNDGEEVPAGKMRLMEVKARDDRSIDMWFGNVQRDGLYINMQSPQRELIIEAARALEPIG